MSTYTFQPILSFLLIYLTIEKNPTIYSPIEQKLLKLAFALLCSTISLFVNIV